MSILITKTSPTKSADCSKPLLWDNEEVLEFDLLYCGSLHVDRRYIPSTFPWLVKHILRQQKDCKSVLSQISAFNLKIMDKNNKSEIYQEHMFDTIYRLSRLRHCGLDNYLAYVTGQNDQSSYFHVFQVDSQEKKAEFLQALKTRVLGFQENCSPDNETTAFNFAPPKPTHRRGVSSGAILVSPKHSDAVFHDSVYYIGKVTISQAQAPPKFIDDVLVKLKKMQRNDVFMKGRRSISGPTVNYDETDSLSPRNLLEVRRRSISCDTQDMENNKPSEEYDDDDDVTLHNIQEEVQSRLVTLQISRTSLMLFSYGTKSLLLEKKIKNISFCTKGEARSDHFGFICREGGSHICYIFQGESEHKVDSLMKAMKVAFVEALEASSHLTTCDSCPIQEFHKLCTKLEGANSLGEQKKILEETLSSFSEYDQLHIANQISEETFGDGGLEVEVTVNILREISDRQQKSHKHSFKIQELLGENTDRDRSKSSTIFEKAKKSFATSLHNFAIKKPGAKGFSPNMQRRNQQVDSKFRSRSFNTSYPDTPTVGGTSLEFTFDDDGRSSQEGEERLESPEVRRMRLQEKWKQRKPSWRQAIYHSVVAPSRDGSVSSITTISDDIEKKRIHPSVKARSRWKNAIRNQILLIRMEKENKKLAASISATEERRQKLSYQEHGTYSALSAILWDEILSRKQTTEVDHKSLVEAVRGGLPRARRGEVWQLLIKHYMLRCPARGEERFWQNESYRSLLKNTTTHQHAILIDLGRTFPTHEHFIARLGSGQLGLFNILKAYSLLDREVGYCQGLSFVAGMFLMHMSEEEAFRCFCHVMFGLHIRDQYKPDMHAVQQQLYQLSRLLHDYHPSLYEHLNVNDVTPTLYAAPWFLTLYASQYPIGFASRVMDMVLLQGLEIIFKVALVMVGNHMDEILKCDSFETIVDYLKLTLPLKVPSDTDDICARVLSMDISSQLHLYEVEYQLLKEEMIDIRQNKEKLEKQAIVHKQLETQVDALTTELSRANAEIDELKLRLAETQRQRDQLLVESSEISLIHKNDIGRNNSKNENAEKSLENGLLAKT